MDDKSYMGEVIVDTNTIIDDEYEYQHSAKRDDGFYINIHGNEVNVLDISLDEYIQFQKDKGSNRGNQPKNKRNFSFENNKPQYFNSVEDDESRTMSFTIKELRKRQSLRYQSFPSMSIPDTNYNAPPESMLPSMPIHDSNYRTPLKSTLPSRFTNGSNYRTPPETMFPSNYISRPQYRASPESMLSSTVPNANNLHIGHPRLQQHSYNSQPPTSFFPENQTSCAVLVGNISKRASAKNFIDFFKQVGTVMQANMFYNSDGSHTGFGIIVFDSPDVASYIISQYHNRIIDNRKLSVISVPNPDSPTATPNVARSIIDNYDYNPRYGEPDFHY